MGYALAGFEADLVAEGFDRRLAQADRAVP